MNDPRTGEMDVADVYGMLKVEYGGSTVDSKGLVSRKK